MSDDALLGARLTYESPMLQLVVWPTTILLSMLVAATPLGDVLLYALSIWFHELGHAIPSWLSGRPAIPLPCGITFGTDEPTWLARTAVLLFGATLVGAGVQEERPLSTAIGFGVLLAAFVLNTIAPARVEGVILASGLGGELVLTTLALVAFHLPMPDRLRWDFLRLPVLLVASGAWAHSTAMWRRVAEGGRLPLGAIFGTAGDRQGDIERLLDGHGATLASIARSYTSLARLCAVVLVATYVIVALRLYVIPRARRAREAS